MAKEKTLNINEIINAKDRMRDLVKDFHAQLNRAEWPKVFYVKDGKTFQELVVALRVEVDWHFDEGDDGFSFFLMGPTMVRVDNQGQPASARANLLRPVDKFMSDWDQAVEAQEKEAEDAGIESEETS